jgi:LemA protein
MFNHLMTHRTVVRGFGSHILIRIGVGLAGAWWGAGCLEAAVSSVQDSTAGFATAEAAAAATGAFVVIAGAGAIIYGFITYSGLSRLGNEVDGAFTQIDVLLKQLFDAMPHLATECTAHMRQESRPLLDLARSRSEWSVAQSSAEKWKVGADAQLALKQIFTLSETYPALHGDERFARLLETLTGIEKQIAVRREQYNAAAGALNARIKQFPATWLADIAGLKSRLLFAAPAEERVTAPTNFTRTPQ